MKLLFLTILPFFMLDAYEPSLRSKYSLRSLEMIQIMELQEQESKVEFIFFCNKSSKEKGEWPMERKKHTFRLYFPLNQERIKFQSEEHKAFQNALVGTRVQVIHLKSGELLVDHEIIKERRMGGTTGGVPHYTIAGSEYLKKGQAYKVTVQLPPKGDKKAIYQKLELVIGIHRGVYL